MMHEEDGDVLYLTRPDMYVVWEYHDEYADDHHPVGHYHIMSLTDEQGVFAEMVLEIGRSDDMDKKVSALTKSLNKSFVEFIKRKAN